MTTALSTGIRRVATRLAPDPAPDGELLSRFLGTRDEAAFAALVRRHAPMVFGTCRRVLGNASDADDAFQAAFVVLVRKAHSLTDRACVGNFLYGVAFHTALKAKAMATKRRGKEVRVKIPLPTSTDDELTAMMDEELANLPDKYREPVVLCELEGVSRKDAAGRLGIPEGTISSRLATAHRMLEKRLRARGVAAVGIAALLGNQAFAVSDKLADAAVRAATSGAPAGITHLVAEVTKMFLLNKLKVGTAVLAGVLLLLGVGVVMVPRGAAADDKREVKAPVPAKPAAKDEDRLQGVWQVVAAEGDGQKAPEEALKRLQFRFKGNEVTMPGDKVLTFKLDAAAKPKGLILTPADGPRKGVEVDAAIYELDGDDLKLCIDQRGPGGKEGQVGTRPADFTTAPRDGRASYVLKRVKEEKKEEDRIQGLWQAESLEAGGQKAPDDAVKLFRIRFKGDKITFLPDDRTHRFELDAASKPKAMTVTLGDGDDKGQKAECGIYELDGDTLKLCIDSAAGATRPTEFKTTAADKFQLLVLKRVKEANPDREGGGADKKPDDAKLLQGKWVTKAVTIDPPFPQRPGEVRTLGHHTLTFTDTDLTWVSFDPNDRQIHSKQTKPFKLDTGVSPKVLTSGFYDCIYELNGDTLKVAMLNRAPGRPKGFTAEDGLTEKGGHVRVIELTREKGEADKGYSLKDGEVLKLIPAPFPDGREDVFKLAGDRHPFQSADDCLMAVTLKDGKPESANAFTTRRTPGADAPGKPLALFLEHSLRIDMAKVADPAGLLESTILDADVVVKKGAKPDDLLAALRKELKAKCGVDLVLEFRDAEMPVIVLSGEHTLNPTPMETGDARVIERASVIHLYATAKQEHANTLIANTRAFPRELAKFLGRPVIDESDLNKNAVIVKTTFHLQHPATAKTRAEDRDPEKVLQNVSNQTGLVIKLVKRQKVRALVVEKANADREGGGAKKDEPAWKAAFRKAYGLTDGQLVRRVAPPYPDCRAEYFKAMWPGRQGNIAFDQWFAVHGWRGDWTDPNVGQSTMPVKPDEGVPLERLLDMTLKFPKTRIESDQTSLERKVTGDFVVRVGADPEKVAVELETILRKELELPVKFSFQDAEEAVYVLGGKYEAKPLKDRKAGRIEVYAKHLTDPKTGGGGTGTLKEMAESVERHVGKTVLLGKVEGGPAKVEWHYNARSPSTRQEYAEDRDAPRVLANIAEQTGLTVATEKRKVRVLVVEHNEVKK